MKSADSFVKTYAELLAGSYDCLDRLVLNGYFLPGQNGGGMRQWWERLRSAARTTLKKYRFERLATMFARRTRQCGWRAEVPMRACLSGCARGAPHHLAVTRPAALLGAPPCHGAIDHHGSRNSDFVVLL